MIKTITTYETSDGKQHASRSDAKLHEINLAKSTMVSYERFLAGYSGQKLLEKYSLTTEGLWRVCGEDPNCDFGGHHHEPYIGTVEGKLQDVIVWAVSQPGFWGWGTGGSIERILIQKPWVIKV